MARRDETEMNNQGVLIKKAQKEKSNRKGERSDRFQRRTDHVEPQIVSFLAFNEPDFARPVSHPIPLSRSCHTLQFHSLSSVPRN